MFKPNEMTMFLFMFNINFQTAIQMLFYSFSLWLLLQGKYYFYAQRFNKIYVHI